MRRVLVAILGLLVTVVLLWRVLQDVTWAKVGDALAQARPAWLILAMAFTMLGYLVRAYRWKLLLMPVKRIGVAGLFRVTLIGFLANIVLPARLGELVRPLLIGRREAVSRSAALATIVVERIFDVTILLLCFGAVLLLYPQGFTRALQRAGIAVLVVDLAALAVFVLLRAYTETFLAVARRLVRPLPAGLGRRIVSLLASFAEGLSVLRSGSQLFRVSLLSAVVWLTIVLSCWATQMALQPLQSLPLHASVVLIVFISVGILLPSAPGYVGPMQWACQAGLAMFGVDPSLGFAFSCLYMVTQHLPVLGAGFYYMWRESLTLGDITRLGSPGPEATR